MPETPGSWWYLFENLVVSESWTTINVTPSCITHHVSKTITGQYAAINGYRFEKIDYKIVLKKQDDVTEWPTYISCREAYKYKNGFLPSFFYTWYFYSEADVHKMNMRWKLKSI